MRLSESYKKRLQELADIRTEKIIIPVPEDIDKIKNIFVANGFKIYLVGGAVRDAILGKTPKDYDLATDAPADTTIKMLKNEPFVKNILETGKKFGIVNVITDMGNEYEIARFRKDIGIGRRPDAVEFTTIDQDVLRRDLTINALFYDLDNKNVVDLVGGIDDLKKGIIRTVGNPRDRFNEDRLRILRAIRFAARFGSNLDSETDKAIKEDSSLAGISDERIRDEFLKGIKSAKSVKNFLELVQKYNLFKWIFGNLKIEKFAEEKNPVLLIAQLLKNNPTSEVLNTLKNKTYTNVEIAGIIFLIELLKLGIDNAYILKKNQKKSKLSDEEIRKFAEINNIDKKLIDTFLNFNLSIGGEEVQADGFKGSEIGQEIARRETENFKNALQGL